MDQYQIFVATKAQVFLFELERVGEIDKNFKSILSSMRPSIEKIIRGEEMLPSNILDGWDVYYLPRDNFMEVLDAHPNLVNSNIELTGLLRHTNMESYQAWRKYLENT